MLAVAVVARQVAGVDSTRVAPGRAVGRNSSRFLFYLGFYFRFMTRSVVRSLGTVGGDGVRELEVGASVVFCFVSVVDGALFCGLRGSSKV